jgi:hypothetical protein
LAFTITLPARICSATQESSWREDNRRVSKSDQVRRVTAAAMKQRAWILPGAGTGTLRTDSKTIRSATYAVKTPQLRIGGRRYLLALDSAQGCLKLFFSSIFIICGS